MERQGSERAVWEARWSWVTGRREGEGQPRSRLMGGLGGVVVIAFNPRKAIRGLSKGLIEGRDVSFEYIMLLYWCGGMKNFSMLMAPLLYYPNCYVLHNQTWDRFPLKLMSSCFFKDHSLRLETYEREDNFLKVMLVE